MTRPNQVDSVLSNEVRQMPILSHDNKAFLDSEEIQNAPLMYDDVALLSTNDVPLLTSITTAQNQEQEIDDQLHVPASSNQDCRLECMPQNSVSAIQVTAVLVTLRQTYTDTFCKVLQSQQQRTLRRGAFRAWGTFARDMAAEERLCNVVCKIKLRTVRREVFHAWRLSGKNQIEALESEIETLNARVHMLEQQKTRQPDMDHIVSELAKRGLFVSTQSQTVQKTVAAQSQVTEQQETKGFFSSITGWGKSKKSTQPPVQVPQITPETKSDKGETSLDSESDKDPRSEPETEPESIEKPPQPLPLCMSKDAPLPPPPPPVSKDALPPPVSKDAPPPPPPPSVLTATNMSDTPVNIASRIPRQKEKSSQNTPKLTSITAVQEAQFKSLMRQEKNGEDLKEIIDREKYDSTIRAYNAYKATITSTDTLAPRKNVQTAKSKQISADMEARIQEESKRAQPKKLIGQGLQKKFGNALGASSGDESSSTWSSSDDEKHSTSSEKKSSIAVEPKGKAEQETPAKEVNCALFSVLGAMIDDDDMPPADMDASANIEDDYEDLC